MSLIIDDGNGNLTLSSEYLYEEVNGNISLTNLIATDDSYGNLIIGDEDQPTEFVIYEDIHISDSGLRENFIDKFNSGQLSEAFYILNNNSQLNNKKFVANIFNSIAEYLTEAQNNV